MPGQDVQKIYQEYLAKGYDQKSAAKISQAKTGLSLVTGRPPKDQSLSKSRTKYYGQYQSQ